MKLKIKKGDNVKVITGDDKGKVGRVLDVDAKKLRVLIEGVNIHSKHEKPNQNNQNGGIVKVELPVHYSNIKLVESE